MIAGIALISWNSDYYWFQKLFVPQLQLPLLLLVQFVVVVARLAAAQVLVLLLSAVIRTY
jgi:hypothetical protein